MTPTPDEFKFTGWAEFHALKRAGDCLACKGRRFLTESYLDGEEDYPCRYCPTDPTPQPTRSN